MKTKSKSKSKNKRVSAIAKKTSVEKKVVRTNRPKKTIARRSSSVSLETGIKIVRHAIKNKVSLSAASKANKRGKNYVSDIKARLEENYKSRNITKNLYDIFRSLNKQYEKSVK